RRRAIHAVRSRIRRRAGVAYPHRAPSHQTRSGSRCSACPDRSMTDLTEHHQAMVELARAGRTDAFIALAKKLEPADLADILALLEPEERFRVVRAMPPRLSGEALVEMPEGAHPEATLAALAPEQAAEIVEELEDDDAADLLGELEPETQERILSEIE